MSKKRRSKEFKNNSQVIDMEEARRKRLEKRRAEREKEEAKARSSERQRTRGKMAIRRSRNRRRLTAGIIVVIIGGIIGLALFNIVSLKKEQHEAEQQQQELKAEKERLQKELDESNDITNVEEQAREQLRLIKKGETIYIFPDEITQNNQEDTESEEGEN